MSLQAAAPRLILASQSAARASLLTAAGLRFDALAPRVDEDEIKRGLRAGSGQPDEAALVLAEFKARRISERHPDAVVIGADQLLVCDGEWLDKPADLHAARLQLQHLRGHRHTLVTAVLCVGNGTVLWHHLARPSLRMRQFSDTVLDAYVALEAGHVTGIVGSYRLEGPGLQLFDAIEGDYFSILGLPLLPLLGFLRQHGVLLT